MLTSRASLPDQVAQTGDVHPRPGPVWSGNREPLVADSVADGFLPARRQLPFEPGLGRGGGHRLACSHRVR